MNEKITEEKMTYLFIKNFDRKGQQLISEVPVFAKSVDMVNYNRKENTITAIEFKQTKWKKAIEQVLALSIAFDFLEICILETQKCKNTIIEECKNRGIGLYFIDTEKEKISHEVMPINKIDIWQLQKLEILSYISMRGN